MHGCVCLTEERLPVQQLNVMLHFSINMSISWIMVIILLRSDRIPFTKDYQYSPISIDVYTLKFWFRRSYIYIYIYGYTERERERVPAKVPAYIWRGCRSSVNIFKKYTSWIPTFRWHYLWSNFLTIGATVTIFLIGDQDISSFLNGLPTFNVLLIVQDMTSGNTPVQLASWSNIHN